VEFFKVRCNLPIWISDEPAELAWEIAGRETAGKETAGVKSKLLSLHTMYIT
jgi:hypothetical protein